MLKDAYLWLDASRTDTMTVAEDGDVTRWNTVSSSGTSAKKYAPPNAPKLIAAAGKPLVSFGTTTANRDLRFGKDDGTEGSDKIRVVYFVGRIEQSYNAFLLGHHKTDVKTDYCFHRGADGKYWADYASEHILNGETRWNGVTVDNPKETLVPAGFGLMSVYATGGVSANQIAYDRGGEDPRRGGKDVAELIILENDLSDSDRALVENYLLEKWINNSVYAADVTGATAIWSTKAGLASSSTWNDGDSVVLTNKQDDATLTLDIGFSSLSFGIVSEAGKTLRLAKAEGVTLDIGAYDLTEAAGDVAFGFDPDFSKVNVGANWAFADFPATGAPVAGVRYRGEDNAFSGGWFSGARYRLDGSGTVEPDGGNTAVAVENGAQMTLGGLYAVNGSIGGRDGTVTIAEGAAVTTPQVWFGRASGRHGVLNVAGSLTVTTASDNGDADRASLKGILFNEYPSTSFDLNVTGTMSAPNIILTTARDGGSGNISVDGGTLELKGIYFKNPGVTLNVRNGGVLALSSGLISQNHCTYAFAGGTLKNTTGGTLAWTPATTAFNGAGNVLDANGGTLRLDGALAGEGAICLTNSAETAGVIDLGTARPAHVLTVGGNVKVRIRFADDAESPVLAFAEPPPEGAFEIYDGAGTLVPNAPWTYDPDTHTVSFSLGRATWKKTENASFELDANWTRSPKDGEDVVVQIDGDTEIDVAQTHSFGRVTFTGAGRVTFTGAGLVAADGTDVLGGVAVVYPARYQFGALTVAAGATATSEGGATVASTAGDGTFAVTNGTLALGVSGGQNRILGAKHLRIEAGGTLELLGRDMVTTENDPQATVSVCKGGTLVSRSFNGLPRVKLYGGTIDAAGSYSTTWRSVCYVNGVEVYGSGVTSRLTTSAPGNPNAVHQLSTGIFEVERGASLVVDAPLANGPGDRGSLKDQVRKTGWGGKMIVNVTPTYTGVTDIRAGDYILNAAHNTAANYTLANGTSLEGKGALPGSGFVDLSQGAVLGGSLKIANLRYARSVTVGNSWHPADVTVTGAIEIANGGTYDDGIAWIDVKKGRLTLGSGLELPAGVRFNAQVDGKNVGILTAGAGDQPVKVGGVARLATHSPGAMLESEVKVVDGQVKTGTFEIDGGFDPAGWVFGTRPVGAARPPVRVPVVTLTEGNAFVRANFNRKAVPADQKYAFLEIDGQTLYYRSNQRLLILVQ